MERRTFLAAIGTLPISFVGGCVADSLDGPAQTGPSTNTAVDDSSAMPKAQGPARGASSIDVEVREVESDENVEYIEESNAVRYVAGWRHTNQTEIEEGEPPEREPLFETTPFQHWGETQCLSVAAGAAAEHVNDELDTDEVSGGVTSTVEGEDRTAIVSVETVLDRDEKVVHSPDVDFETLVAATPATVEATYVLGEHEYELGAPVYARYSVLQYD